MTLNITEEKFLKLILPLIKDIQVFVDKNIIGSNAMKAADVYTNFSKEYDCGELDQESFVKGFRAAVKNGDISGIIGAKRAGYKRIGKNLLKSQSSNNFTAINPYIENIQKFVNERIILENTRMTAVVVFENFSKEYDCDLEEDEFVKCFRYIVFNKQIKGLKSFKRFGYGKANNDISIEDEEGDFILNNIENEESCTIMINSHTRIISLDKYNWGYQTKNKNSGNWMTDAYFDSAKTAIKAIANKAVDNEFKTLDSCMLNDFISRIEKIERKFSAIIEQVVRPSKLQQVA